MGIHLVRSGSAVHRAGPGIDVGARTARSRGKARFFC